MALHRIAKEMGYKSNEDFYKDYKTEADFLKFKNGGKLKEYSLGDYLDEEGMPTDYLGNTTGYQNTRLGTFSGTPTYNTEDADNDGIPNELEGSHSDADSKANQRISKNFGKIPVVGEFQEIVADGQTAITDETEGTRYEDAGQGLANQLTPHKGLFGTYDVMKDPNVSGAKKAERLGRQFIDPLGGTLSTALFGEYDSNNDFLNMSEIKNRPNQTYDPLFAKEGGPIPSYNNGGPMLIDYAGGQGHEGNPEQGIPIDSNGIPTVNYNNGGNLSGEAATALVSGGGDNKEVAFTDPETKQTYIFSDEHYNQDKKVTAFAKEARKELARIERRPNDSSTENTSLITLRKLRDEQEAIKQAKIEEAQNTLAQFQPPSQDPNTGQMFARMGGNIGELPMYDAGGVPFNKPEHPHLPDGSHPSSEPEELGSAGFERTDKEKRLANLGTAAQFIPYIVDAAKGPVETAKRPTRETPNLSDMTLAKNLAENKIKGAYAGAKKTVRENPGSRSEFLTRTGSLASSEAEKTGSTVAALQTQEDKINLDLTNKYKGEKYADAVAEAELFDMSEAAKRNRETANLTGLTDTIAGATKDANLYTANDRFNQQQMLALSTANPDIQFRDNGDGTFTMLRATNIT